MNNSYFTNLWDKNLEASRRRSLSLLPKLNDEGILVDAGCGNGKLSYRAMSAAGLHEVVGLELSSASARNAKSSQLRVIRADLNVAIPLSDESVDLVFAHHIFAHLTDHDTFVNEVFRVLKPNGYCIVSTENLSGWHNILALIAGFQDFSHNVSSVWYLGNPLSPHYRRRTPSGFSPHYKIFTPRSLRDIFEAHGFQVERLIGTGVYPLPRLIAGVVEQLDPWHSQFLTLKARKRPPVAELG
jgi:SAM-dependent methyltransferase